MQDEYKTILQTSEGIFRDRGSKFLATALPLRNLEQVDEHLHASRKQHPKARHHCYAYRLQPDGAQFRTNDDGEPSGTAGRPLLGQIDSFGLTNVMIIVVRYFGGTKLGTSGLINAYRSAAREALSEATISQQTVKAFYRIAFDYGKMSEVMSAVKSNACEIIEQSFTDTAELQIAIKAGDREEVILLIGAAIAGKIPEVYDARKDQEGWSIEFLRIN